MLSTVTLQKVGEEEKDRRNNRTKKDKICENKKRETDHVTVQPLPNRKVRKLEENLNRKFNPQTYTTQNRDQQEVHPAHRV